VLTLLGVTTQALAERPSTPGTPTGTLIGTTVTLTWAASEDDIEVRGYNVYQNAKYLKTVFSNQFAGQVDNTRTNTFFVTAFDTPAAGEERAYSQRSSEIAFPASIPGTDGPIEPVDTDTDTQSPSIPDGLTATSALDDLIAFNWAPATDNIAVAGYNIYRQGQYIDTVFTTKYIDSTVSPD